jgi:hypothetical protein
MLFLFLSYCIHFIVPDLIILPQCSQVTEVTSCYGTQQSMCLPILIADGGDRVNELRVTHARAFIISLA